MFGLSIELITKGKLATVRSGDVSSASPLSERIKELWVVCVYIVSCGGSMPRRHVEVNFGNSSLHRLRSHIRF